MILLFSIFNKIKIMSFVGNKQNKGELKLVDKFDENLKNKIKDKLNELQTKNSILNEKVNKSNLGIK